MNKAALFDLDGVLIDTEGIYTEHWKSIGEEYNVGIPNFAHVIKGTTLVQILSKYFPKEEHEGIIARLKAFEGNMQFRIFPGVERFLQQLKERGIPAVIVTSSGEAKMNRLWQQHPGFCDYFIGLVTDAQVKKSKPDPEGYLLGAKLANCDPKDCYVFEDSFNGLEAGRRSGAKVIALATTNPASSLDGKADLIIDGFNDFTVDDMLAV